MMIPYVGSGGSEVSVLPLLPLLMLMTMGELLLGVLTADL